MPKLRLAETWTRWGIRKQLTAVAVLLVAVPLCLGIILLANLLTNALATAQVTSAREVAHRTASYVSEHGPEGMRSELQLDDGYRAQLWRANRTLLWTSNSYYKQPFSEQMAQPGQVLEEGKVQWWGPGDRNEHRDLVIVQGLSHDGQDYVVQIATSQEDQQSAVTVTTGLLLACVPLVMLAAGLISWWVAGRALRPVDQMNDRVSRITSSTLDERIPLPPTEDELRDLALTMNQMLARLETAHHEQQRFISDASHELRSPLASLSGALEISVRDDRLDTWREMAPLMQAETGRLNQLVQGLLALSRSGDGASPLNLVETDLDDLASVEAARLRSTTSVEVVTRITAARLVADPVQLSQVVRNLCDNAARHARSTVQVTVRPLPDGGAVLRVEDDGNGIAPNDRKRVFDRFVRLEESRSRDEGGSGLGLAIVQQIVTAHGGRIWVEDSPLGGACFEVLLPGRE
ncbi:MULTISPECIES: sensor histidine kinase [unclassified Luteococcus]|uniref:sensor histidine kinase n=1 Tax=unclassified Luteococcus TaxID=2639923 RepID=UPI00313D5D08